MGGWKKETGFAHHVSSDCWYSHLLSVSRRRRADHVNVSKRHLTLGSGGEWTFQIGMHLWYGPRRYGTCIGVLGTIHISRHLFFFSSEEWYSLLWRLHQILPSAFSMCIFPSVTLRWSTSSSAAATGVGGKGNEDFIFLFLNPPLPSSGPAFPAQTNIF